VSERSGCECCLLVKWEGLPYCECTWETEADVMAAKGGPEARDDFLNRQQRLQVTRAAPGRPAHCSCCGGIASRMLYGKGIMHCWTAAWGVI
jgi:hypothetical protein